MLRLATLLLAGQVDVGAGQFGGFGGFFGGLIPTGLPTIPAMTSDIGGAITDIIAGSAVPGIATRLPAVPSGLEEFLGNLLAGSPLPAALPSDQNGPWMALLNGSALPHGLVPSEYEEIFNNIVHGSAVPEAIKGYEGSAQNLLAGSAFPTRRMPTIPVIPGMPSIDVGPYQDMLGQLFDSVKDLFSGVDAVPADLLKQLAAEGFAVPSIDPQGLLSNRNDYLSKIREQFQKLAEKLREKGILNQISTLRNDLHDVLGGRKQFNISDADGYLNKLSGLVGIGGLNSTFQGVLQNISMGDVHDSMRRIGALVSQNGEKFQKMTGDFQFGAQRLIDGAENIVYFNRTTVGLPSLPLLNQTLTIVEWASNPYEGLTGRKLNSSVISVMLADAASGNETLVRGLEQLINITLRLLGGGGGDGSVPTCVYWNTSVADWLGDGCSVQQVLNDSVVCGCNHMTDFAVVFIGTVAPEASAPVTVVSSTSGPRPSYSPMGGGVLAVGSGAVAEPAKDMKPLIGGIVGGLTGSLLLSIVAANLWDRHKKARRARKVIAAVAPTVVNPTYKIATIV